MMDTRYEYIEKIKDNLAVLDAKISKLEAKANEKRGEARREFESTLSDIRESREKVEQRFEELRDATPPAWDDIKLGADQAWTSLSRAVERARERLQ